VPSGQNQSIRIHAYVLASDPTWLQPSLLAYYDQVAKIVVSYDEGHRGWSGAPVAVDRCLRTLRKLDRDGKLELRPGRFTRSAVGAANSANADTRQRQIALKQAGAGADWVVQIDTDEVLPRWDSLCAAIEEAERRDLPAVEWPMRVLFRRLRDGRYLQVVAVDGSPHFEYPGPVAVRPGVRLVDCRRTDGSFLRPVVRGDISSLQVVRPPEKGENRFVCVDPEDAIWHNSWGRPSSTIRSKIRSWGHGRGAWSWLYYYATWLPSPLTWRMMRDFNHVYPPLWPRLAIVSEPPFETDDA
jgi:hypothetical protein